MTSKIKIYSSLKGIKTDISITQYDETRSCSNIYIKTVLFSYVVESAKTGRLKLQSTPSLSSIYTKIIVKIV